MRKHYVAMDLHSASIAVEVQNGSGKVLRKTTIEPTAKEVRHSLAGLGGQVFVVFEEGTQAQWLYDLVSPLVTAVIVCDPRHNKLVQHGNKSDRVDAHKLAELLRLGYVKAVDHRDYGMRQLKELVRIYECLVQDTTRVMNRLKAIFRGQSIKCAGVSVYRQDHREKWLQQLSEVGRRRRAQSLYEQLAVLIPLRQEAKLAMQREARRQPAYQWLMSVPRLGAVSVAQLLAIVGSPHRFRTKRQFWPYVGLAVVTEQSGEQEFVAGHWQRTRKRVQTRGLNRNYNRRLKKVFKAAANGACHSGPFAQGYQQRVERGMNPDLVKLTIARQLAAITLRVWKDQVHFEEQKMKLS